MAEEENAYSFSQSSWAMGVQLADLFRGSLVKADKPWSFSTCLFSPHTAGGGIRFLSRLFGGGLPAEVKLLAVTQRRVALFQVACGVSTANVCNAASRLFFFQLGF